MDVPVPASDADEGWGVIRLQVLSAQFATGALRARAVLATTVARGLVDESRRARELRGRESWLGSADKPPPTRTRSQANWTRALQADLQIHSVLEQARGILSSQGRSMQVARCRRPANAT